MATTPMLQSVLLWQHHQTTTPNLPFVLAAGVTARQLSEPAKQQPQEMAKPTEEKQETVDDDTLEEDDEENEESDEEENGKEHK